MKRTHTSSTTVPASDPAASRVLRAADRPETGRPLSRRRFLARCAAAGAAASLPGLWACSNEFEPGETWKLWVARSLRGVVQSASGSIPIVGAIVDFRAGLKLNEYVLFGSTTSGIGGVYQMMAEEHPGADAGYWRFIIDHSFFRTSSDDVPIYCQVEGKASGRSEVQDFTLLRKPQKSLPPESEAFHLVRNVVMF